MFAARILFSHKMRFDLVPALISSCVELLHLSCLVSLFDNMFIEKKLRAVLYCSVVELYVCYIMLDSGVIERLTYVFTRYCTEVFKSAIHCHHIFQISQLVLDR